jgi:hypothetical protein
MRIVQGCKLDAFSNGGFDFLGDEHGSGKCFSTVDHTMTNPIDLMSILDHTMLGMEEKGENDLDRDFMILDLTNLPQHTPPFRTVGAYGIAGSDLLHHSFGGDMLIRHVDELKFDGRASTIQYEDLHVRT